jgi:hypothetical protein
VSSTVSDAARVLLAGVRLANGAVSFVSPAAFARRLDLDPDESPGSLYGFRLFGVRTVLIGVQLLARDNEARRRAVRVAPYVHAADTLAALVAGATGHLPASGARKAALVSSVNTALALIARNGASRPGRRRAT